jgi:hypothetical protein
MKDLFKNNKKATAIYSLWVLIHIYTLLVKGNVDFKKSSDFWPMNGARAYDLSEFIIYLLIPIVGLIIYNAFKKEKK